MALTGVATMKDVAEAARVSKSTVSHVINGTRFVDDETKRRVQRAIDELGYLPNAAARSLTTKRSQTLGVIVGDVANYFFSELLKGVEETVRSQEYSLIVCNTSETLELEDHYLRLLLSQKVDGIIAMATSQQWTSVSEAQVRHMPIVFVDREFPGLEGQRFVGVDNARGAYLAVEHLIGLGHRKIGTLAGAQGLSTMSDRLRGFRQAMGDHGLEVPDAWVVPSELSADAGHAAANRILAGPERPTALFIANNYLTLGALLALRENGLQCPDDVSIVGFDDHPWAAVTHPPLTVVRQPAMQIGATAGQMILDSIRANDSEPRRVVLECELVIRRSCRALRDPSAEDELGVRPMSP
jgi:LacI family transcriptional regulator